MVAAIILSQIIYKKVDLASPSTVLWRGLGLRAGRAAGHLPRGLSVVIGWPVGGAIVVFAVPLLDKLKIDDVVAAIPVPLARSIWGYADRAAVE